MSSRMSFFRTSSRASFRHVFSRVTYLFTRLMSVRLKLIGGTHTSICVCPSPIYVSHNGESFIQDQRRTFIALNLGSWLTAAQALLSRCRVFVLERLSDDDIARMLNRAIRRVMDSITGENGPNSSQLVGVDGPSTSIQLSQAVSSSPTCPSSPAAMETDLPEEQDSLHFPLYPQITDKVVKTIASLANGDGRAAISLLELAITSPKTSDETTLLTSLKRSVSTSYDRTGDSHYDAISGNPSR